MRVSDLIKKLLDLPLDLPVAVEFDVNGYSVPEMFEASTCEVKDGFYFDSDYTNTKGSSGKFVFIGR